MNYHELVNRIMYSNDMKALNSRISPINGISDAGRLARDMKSLSASVAINNKLDPDYCELLALAKYIGTPPYGKEGQIALNEILSGGFNQTNATIKRLKKIFEAEVPEKLQRDIAELNGGDAINSDSNEVRCVALLENMLETYSLLTSQEIEKMGGRAILQSALADNIKLNADGKLIATGALQKIQTAVAPRRKGLDPVRKDAAKKDFEDKMINAVVDEQTINRLIGE